jgi:hypothetical protein
MYPKIDPNGDDFFAYSFKAAELMEKILLAAGAQSNFCMGNFQTSLAGIAYNMINRINSCVKV